MLPEAAVRSEQDAAPESSVSGAICEVGDLEGPSEGSHGGKPPPHPNPEAAVTR